VLGLCDANERRYFLIDNKDKIILYQIIKQEVINDTIIHSDCWVGYNELSQYGYDHHMINHSKNNKDPIANTYTQRIESLWIPLKLLYSKRRGISPKLLSR